MRTGFLAPMVAVGIAAASAACNTVNDTEQAPEQEQASRYAIAELTPFIQAFQELHELLAQTNANRSAWAAYTDDWKAWTPSQAERHTNSYGYAEYRWSARKDRSYRLAHMTGPIAKALRDFQQQSQGKLAELFITDAKGGNVVQTQPTSDWFQGDEAKFANAASSGSIAVSDPARDDTVGKVGVHVSLPIMDEEGALLGVAIALVVIED